MLGFLFLACIIFEFIVLWKFAVKTGNPGWSLYIPIYSYYVLCKIAGLDTIWFVLSVAPSIVISVFPGNIGIAIICYIVAIIVSFYYCCSLARKFGKGFGYAFGLFFLNPVFMAILALNKKCVYRNY